MDCSYAVVFSHQNDWTSKRYYKALDFTVNQCLTPSLGIFEECDCKVETFVDDLALVES